MTRVTFALLVLAGFLVPHATGQATPPTIPAEIERLVEEGQATTVETRLAGGRTAEEKHLVALAYVNQARRAGTPGERQKSFAKAGEKYEAWIKALAPVGGRGSTADRVRMAAARIEYAGMILSAQAAAGLDEFELTNGRHGDRAQLTKLLDAARAQYEQAQRDTQPLMDDLPTHEEALLAAGLYDTLRQGHLDVTLNLGWAFYYQGVLEEKDDARRYALLVAAERKFQELLNSGQAGPMRHLCYLGLAMTQREQKRYKDATESFRYVFEETLEPVPEARARYELARCQIAAGQFDEARTTLRPLIEAAQSASDARGARFYLNLAQIWDAHSYLLEADALRRAAREDIAQVANLQRADRIRETGLGKMNRLAAQGPPWPALVQLYVEASLDLRRRLGDLSPLELLYTARWLAEAKKYPEAAERLQEAAQRQGLDPGIAADVLFELGRCQYRMKKSRAAAETFAKLAAEHRAARQAPQAATLAYQLWGQVAEESKRPDDYLALAATLRNLVESFADHPDRTEALWLLPIALQLGGRHDEAAQQFAKVPADSPHWEEAQFRHAMCSAQSWEARRPTLSADQQRTEGVQAAEGLLHYADAARQRAAAAADPAAVRGWSNEARLAAAQLLLAPGLEDYPAALVALQVYEQDPPDSALLGRVLALRIRAYRGQREFDQAAQILKQFLETASAEQAGATLAALAAGMQQEVQRLLDAAQPDAARQLATDSLATFDELEKWVLADPSRAQNLEFVQYGRARMCYLAGDLAAAGQLAAALLGKNPKNGNYQHLHALVLTARLPDTASPAELSTVQSAWATLLSDPGIRQRAPERYWEARCNWLALALRMGQAADVDTAITQERIWYPDLGGPPWAAKLMALLAEARTALGKPLDTQPATQP